MLCSKSSSLQIRCVFVPELESAFSRLQRSGGQVPGPDSAPATSCKLQNEGKLLSKKIFELHMEPAEKLTIFFYLFLAH